jgi:hypothetical protein
MGEGILALAAGLLLLFFGRRLFWLAAALIAFLFGWQLFGGWFDTGLSLVLAGILGIIFAWLAIRFIRIAAFIVGFLAGAFALPILVGFFIAEVSWFLLALTGGVIGVILVGAAFDWGLILITTWAGASAVSSWLGSYELGEPFETVVFFGLLIVGIGWQASRRRKMI